MRRKAELLIVVAAVAVVLGGYVLMRRSHIPASASGGEPRKRVVADPVAGLKAQLEEGVQTLSEKAKLAWAQFYQRANKRRFKPSGQWVRLADLPEPKAGHGTCAGDGRIYVAAGGWDRLHTSTMFAYDIADNVWLKCSDAPFAVQSPIIEYVGGRLWFIGGHDSTRGYAGEKTNVCAAYDPVTDTWSIKASMPTPREDMGSVVIGSEIWIWGGLDNRGHAITQEIEVYDTCTDTWRVAGIWPTPRCLGNVAASDGIRTWLLSGTQTMKRYPFLRPDAHARCYEDGMFAEMPRIPHPHCYTDPVWCDGVVYLFGGCDLHAYHGIDRVDRFDVAKNRWLSPTVVPYAAYDPAVCVYENSCYISGGGINHRSQVFFYRFTPETKREDADGHQFKVNRRQVSQFGTDSR